MTVVPFRQTHSFRPIVRPILLDLLHLLRDVGGAFVGLLHFIGQWVDDLGAHDAWDAHLAAGGVPAGPAAFSEQIFERAVPFGPGPAVDRLFPASHSTYTFGPW